VLQPDPDEPVPDQGSEPDQQAAEPIAPADTGDQDEPYDGLGDGWVRA
jgi:hypothetical protein